MSNYKACKLLIVVVGFMTMMMGIILKVEAVEPTKRIVAYLRTWELDKGGYWKAEDIQGDKLTTLNIVGGTNDGFPNLSEEIAKLHHKYPHLQINLCIGGSTADGFSDMVSKRENRQVFIKEVINWVSQYGFNGVDIDWEFYVGEGGTKGESDIKQTFTALLAELRTALEELSSKSGEKYELSFAAPAFSDYVKRIEPQKVAAVVDYVNIMCYDFHGRWTETTGHLANLYPTCENGVQNFRADFLASKIVLGVPFYSRGWEGVPNINNGLYQKPVKFKLTDQSLEGLKQENIPDHILKDLELLKNQEVNGEDIFLKAVETRIGSKEMVKYKTLISQYAWIIWEKSYSALIELKEKGGFTRYWDDTAKAAYWYNGDTWITYEDEQSLIEKVKYINEKGLGGIMIWEYAQDIDGRLLDIINKNLIQK